MDGIQVVSPNVTKIVSAHRLVTTRVRARKGRLNRAVSGGRGAGTSLAGAPSLGTAGPPPSLAKERMASDRRPTMASQRGDSGNFHITSGNSRIGTDPMPNSQRQPHCGII